MANPTTKVRAIPWTHSLDTTIGLRASSLIAAPPENLAQPRTAPDHELELADSRDRLVTNLILDSEPN
jgi:hypothetical protein